MNHNKQAILLIAHGSRREEANQDLYQLVEMVRNSRPEFIVEPAFLELTQPTIPEGASRCVTQGASHVYMLPYFLSAGTHVVDDLQRYQCEFSETWSQTTFTVCAPLGLHPFMVQIVMDRLREAEIRNCQGN